MKLLVGSTLLVLVLVGCTGGGITISLGQPTATPTATDTPTPTPTATPNLDATATAQAQATSTAQAIAQATARAQSTATAQAQATTRVQSTATAAAQATATMQAFINSLNALAQTAKRADLHDKGELNAPAPYIQAETSRANLRNFVWETKFYNPGQFWKHHFAFRITSPYSQYRLLIDSTSTWILWRPTEGLADAVGGKIVTGGQLSNLDLSPNGSNHFRLIVQDKAAYFFVNGAYISALDVSEVNTSGEMWIGGSGGTHYENFIVSALP